MTVAVAHFAEGTAALAAALAAACVLVLREPRSRAAAMPVALALAAGAVGLLSASRIRDELSARAGLLAVAAVVGVLFLLALAVLLHRRPALVVLFAIAALPFRIPAPTGHDDTANLLLPLYVVIAAACAAHVWRALRGEPEAGELEREDPRMRRLTQALALVVVVYALQALYSTDVEHAVKTLGFFAVPFAVLFRLLVEVRWSRRLLLQALGVIVALALLFAVVGFAEWATGRLLISNEKVLAANDLKPYFRVNSLFFDPNVYGRFLALVMVVLAGVLLWAPARRDVTRVAVALALLWAALVLTLSESSFAALLVGLAVLAALRWKPWPVAGVCGGILVVALAAVALAPGALGVKTGSFSSVNEASSGRAKLIRAGLNMARDRPLTGFGSGSFAERYRVREHVVSSRLSAESHTIPVTIAAEQGLIGLAAYAFLLWTAFAVAFGGLRRTLRRRQAGVVLVGRCVVAAAFCALLLHTFVYAAFLEDPLTWTLLAMAAALRRVDPDADVPALAAARAEPVPT
ncbi:MAG: O-antigen ligase family protein [Solirubrobacteraceae bacterium]